MKTSYIAWSLCVLSVVSGCSSEPVKTASAPDLTGQMLMPRSAKVPENLIEKPATESKDGVGLLGAGEAPMTRLRYSFEKGQRLVVAFEIDTKAVLDVSHSTKPKQKSSMIAEMTIELEVSEVLPGGAAVGDWRLAAYKIRRERGTPDPLSARARRATKSLVGTKGQFLVDRLGKCEVSDIESPARVAEQEKTWANYVGNIVKQLFLELPEQAVGIGASWRIKSPANICGMQLSQLALVTLTEVTDLQIRVDIRRNELAFSQELKSVEPRDGEPFYLNSLRGDCREETTIVLDSLFIESTSSGHTSQSLSMAREKEEVDITVEIDEKHRLFAKDS